LRPSPLVVVTNPNIEVIEERKKKHSTVIQSDAYQQGPPAGPAKQNLSIPDRVQRRLNMSTSCQRSNQHHLFQDRLGSNSAASVAWLLHSKLLKSMHGSSAEQRTAGISTAMFSREGFGPKHHAEKHTHVSPPIPPYNRPKPLFYLFTLPVPPTYMEGHKARETLQR